MCLVVRLVTSERALKTFFYVLVERMLDTVHDCLRTPVGPKPGLAEFSTSGSLNVVFLCGWEHHLVSDYGRFLLMGVSKYLVTEGYCHSSGQGPDI